jgi:hypothetical protein
MLWAEHDSFWPFCPLLVLDLWKEELWIPKAQLAAEEESAEVSQAQRRRSRRCSLLHKKKAQEKSAKEVIWRDIATASQVHNSLNSFKQRLKKQYGFIAHARN